jgi:hypothetical protein
MTLRLLLTRALAAFATVALPVLAQTTPPAQTASQAPVVPPHNCVAPTYPTKEELSRKRGDAYNRAVEAFNRDNKAYGDCIRKYVEDTKVWVKAFAEASNKAIDEYNKYVEAIKKTVEEEKE